MGNSTCNKYSRQKQIELNVLNTVLMKSNKPLCSTGLSIYKCLHGKIDSVCESPDFVIHYGDKRIGVEHFLMAMTVIGDINNMPLERFKQKCCSSLYKKYNGDVNAISAAIDNGSLPKDIEDLINRYVSYNNDFSYSDFVYRFHDEFCNGHVLSVDKYKTHCDALGFLIEMPDAGHHMYHIDYSSFPRYFSMVPFTYDMRSCIDYAFENYVGLDFMIFVFDEHSVLYLGRDSWKDDLRKQEVQSCRRFDVKRIDKKILIST